jgi:hypothetical protein
MSRHILLDSTPLGLLTKPIRNATVVAITQWAASCLAAGHRIYVPEVIDSLAAQAFTVQIPTGDDIIVATDNVGHLSRFVSADLWGNIAP